MPEAIQDDQTKRTWDIETDGSGKVKITNSMLEIAKGTIAGTSYVHKFGKAPDFDTGDGFVTVWDGANDALTDQMQYVYSTATRIDSLSSSIDTDTQDIEVQGLNGSYAPVNQTITLTGQTRKALDTDLIRVFRMKNVSSTDLSGTLYCYENSTVASGVPSDSTKVRGVITIGHNQTLMAVYTVPAGKTGYLCSMHASIAGALKTSAHVIHLEVRPFGQVFQTKHTGAINGTGTSHMMHPFTVPEVIPAKADVEIHMDTDTGVAAVSAGFDLIVIDD